MSDFRARIIAELDTSRVDKNLKTIEGKKVLLNNISINTAGLAKKIQAALNGHQFTLNLTNVRIDNLSKTITGQMRSAGTQAGQDFSQSLLNKINTTISSGGIDSSIASIRQKFEQLNTVVNNMGSGAKTTELQQKLKLLETDFATLTALQEEFAKGGLSNEQLVSKYDKFNTTLSKIKNSMTVVRSETKQFASAVEVASLQNKMESWLNTNTRATKAYGTQVQGYINTLKQLSAQGNVSTADLNNIANGFKRVDMAAESAGLKGKAFGSSIAGALKSITRYVGVSTFIYAAFNAIRNGIKNVVALDTALVDLQKTSDATASQLKQFYFSANDIAKQLGATTQEVIQAAAEWSRLGYSIKDAQTMAEVSSIFASISPGMDIETATDGLVSVMKAFNIEADDALDGIASKINSIGNSQAVTNEDIVNFLTRSSAAMKEANNTLEETIALGTAATEITRNADQVGNAMKIISMRIRGYDEETEEFVGGLEILEGEISNLTKTASKPGGISLFTDESKTEYKSTYQLLKEISEIYDELTDKQQAQLLEKLAGKRQGQIVAAILNNFDAVDNSLETMTNSAGSAMREMGIIEQSLEFKLNALKETAVGVFQNLFQTDQMGVVIDILTDLMNILDFLTEKLGLFGTALVGIGITAFVKNFDQIRILGLQGAKSIDTVRIATANMASEDLAATLAKTNLTAAEQAQILMEKGISETRAVMIASANTLSEADLLSALTKTSLTEAITAETLAESGLTEAQIAAAVAASGLTAENLALILATTGLTAEKQAQILINKGLSASEAEAMVATAAHSATNIGAAATTGILTGATTTLSTVLKGLWATLKANPIIAVITVVAALAVAMVKLAGAAKEASKAADELKQSSMEEAQKAREEVQTLDQLIAKYKKLANSDTQDVKTRSEIASVQSDITDLVGAQADNLDLVNGKLDKEIAKLNQIKKDEATKAVTSSVSAYHAAKDSHDKAMGEDSALWLDGYAYVSDDWWSNEDDVIELLQNNGFSQAVQKGGVFGSHTYIMDTFDENMKPLEGATEKAEFLTKMIDTIKQNYSDYASSDIYNALVKQRDVYIEYGNDMKKAAKDLADSEIIAQSYDGQLGNIDVNSLENYEKYRDKLVELVSNSPNLKEAIANGDLTADDIAGRVDTYLGTMPQFSEYYNQFSKLEKQKNKIEELKNTFKASEWFKDADGGTADKRLESFTKWIDSLSDGDKDIVYKISCETDTAKFNLQDWKDALANYNVVASLTADNIKQRWENSATTTNKIISNISDAQNALSSQKTGVSISIDDFNSDELADYRSALEYVNGTMQLNADKVNEIVKAKSDEQIALNNTNKALAQAKYLDNAKQIEQYREQLRSSNNLSQEQKTSIQNSIDALLNENNALADTCSQYDLLSASLREATGAYQHWLNAQNSSDYGDMADDAVSAIQRIRDTYDSDSDIFGNFGSKKFDAAVDFIVPDSVDSDDVSAIESYMADFKKYLSFDDDGKAEGLNIDKFLSDSVEAGLMSYSEDEGFKILGGKKMEDFAEGLNLSSGVVQAFFDELQLKGGEFDWGDEAVKTIGDLAIEANEAAESLRKIDGNSDLKIKMDVSDLTTTEEQVAALDATIAEMDGVKAKPGVDSSEIDNANAVIQYCLMQKQLLTQPDVMRVDTSKCEEDIGKAISLLQEFQNAQNDLEIKKKVGADTTEAQTKIDSLASEIQNLSPDIKVKLGNLDTTSVEAIKTSISSLSAEMIVKAGVDASAITGYTPETKQCDVIYNPKTDLLPQSFDSINRTVVYKSDTSGLPQNFSTITRYVNYVKTGNVDVNGTAHLSGTAKAGGDWGTAPGGETLVGELGREIVVDPHTGKWYTVGDNGAEFRNIPAGSIVFNHLQTKQLLENGYVSGRASALVSGTALVTGGYKPYKQGGSSGGSSGSSSDKSSSSSSKSSSSSNSDEKEPQIFDWIEIALDRIQRAIDNLSKKAESTFKKLSTRLNVTNKEIAKVNEEINLQQKAADRYMKEANSVGLSSSLAKQVREGTIDINEYDEDTQKLIEDYQKWYEKALDCKDAIQDLHEELAKLYEDNFKNVQDDYENQLSLYEHLTNTYETGIDILEAKGYMASTKYYSAMQNVEQKNIAIRKKELAELEKQFSAAMNSGEIEKYSEAWYGFQTSINEVKEAIAESEVNLAEFAKTIREIEWERFDYIQDRISKITDEADFLIDLMENSDLYDDRGQLSDTGMATMGLHGQNYNVYMAQADKYAKELLAINKEIDKDPYNTELIERREELLKLQQDSIFAAEDEKQAIVDMVEKGIKLELDALKDLIDTYTDALDNAKNLYEYQNKVNDKASEIAKLQKQLSAYAGDTSEETRVTVQKITVDLAEAQKDLQETEYQQFISDTKKLLDELYTEYEEILNQRLDDVDALISDMIDTVNLNSDTINTTLGNIASDVGYTLTPQMQAIWDGSTGALDGTITKYGDKFDEQNTAVKSVLDSISANVAAMVAESEKEATKTSSTASTTTPSKPASSSTPSTSSSSPSSSSTPKRTDKENYGVALAIINGNYGWGTGDTRKKNLQAKGFNYNTVQGIVNKLIKEGYVNSGAWVGRYYGIKDLSPYSIKKFKLGGLVDYTGLAQLDGTPNKPELVLNSEDTENFIALRDILRAMSAQTITLGGSYNFGSTPSLKGISDISGILATMRTSNGNMGTTFGDFEINIPIEKVEDYNDFVRQLQKDDQFEKMILSMTVDRIAGKSSLEKYKYRW